MAHNTQHKVQRGLFLDVVVRQGTVILKLLTRKNQALLIRRDALLVLNFLLDPLNRVRRIDVQRNGFARESLDEDLHFCLGLPCQGGIKPDAPIWA